MVHCFLTDPHKNVMVEIGEADTFGMLGSFTKGYGGKDAPSACLASDSGVSCQHITALGNEGYIEDQKGAIPGTQGRKARQLVVGTATCELDDFGIVRCWGENYHAVLGQPDPRLVERLLPVPDLPTMRAVAVGTEFSCGLSADGEVYCWGHQAKKLPGLSRVDRLVANNCCACAFSAGGEATCFDKTFRPMRVPAFDGVRDVIFDFSSGSRVAAIGKSSELLVGSGEWNSLQLKVPPGVGKVQRLASAFWILLAQDVNGKMWSMDIGPPELSDKPRRFPAMDGALSLSLDGAALLTGGKLVALAPGQPTKTLGPASSSSLVSLLGPYACGLTATGAFRCPVYGEFPGDLFQGMKQIASSGAHQCAIDDAGIAQCRGANRSGQCGQGPGIERADTPIEVHLH